MKKLKAFAYVYKNSLTSFKYYKEVAAAKTAFSVKYFVALTLLASLITVVRLGVTAVPELRSFSKTVLDDTKAIYPQDLVIDSKENAWSINKDEPFAIKTPNFMRTELTAEAEEEFEFPENLITFYHEGTINDLELLDTFVLVNDVNLIVQTEEGKIEAHKLTGLQEGTFDKAKFDEVMVIIEGLTAFIPMFVYGTLLVVSFFYFFVYRLWYLVIVAAGLMLVGSFKRLNLPFGTYYRVALHSFTLPLTLEVLLILFGGRIDFPLWQLIINLLIGFLVLTTIESAPPPKSEAQK